MCVFNIFHYVMLDITCSMTNYSQAVTLLARRWLVSVKEPPSCEKEEDVSSSMDVPHVVMCAFQMIQADLGMAHSLDWTFQGLSHFCGLA